MAPEDENGLLTAENAALREQVTVLATWVQELEELEARLDKDSHNSGKPPSSDGLARKTKSLRRRSGKKPKGQIGHRGETLRLVATPNDVVEHRPAICSGCQKLLGEEAPLPLQHRRQVQELPLVRLMFGDHQPLHVCCPACDPVTSAPRICHEPLIDPDVFWWCYDHIHPERPPFAPPRRGPAVVAYHPHRSFAKPAGEVLFLGQGLVRCAQHQARLLPYVPRDTPHRSVKVHCWLGSGSRRALAEQATECPVVPLEPVEQALCQHFVAQLRLDDRDVEAVAQALARVAQRAVLGHVDRRTVGLWMRWHGGSESRAYLERPQGHKRDWLPDEDAALRAYFAVLTRKALCMMLPGRALPAIYHRAYDLGLSRKKGMAIFDEVSVIVPGPLTPNEMAPYGCTVNEFGSDAPPRLRG